MINIEKLRTPQAIFIIYTLVCALLIMIFRFILPGSEAPLPIYSFNWRLLRGALDLFDMLPAVFFSALVVPFGMASHEEKFQSFSDIFFKRLFVSIITTICAAVVYGLIFFLALPMLKNYEENLRFSGERYQQAKKKAYERSGTGDWKEAAQFLVICDTIWYNSPELSDIFRSEVADNVFRLQLEENRERANARSGNSNERRNANTSPLTGSPVDSPQEAMAMYNIAMEDERYFDAHWLAVVAERLAIEGSPEQAEARRNAGEAWNKISSQAPNRIEQRFTELFEKKVLGYTLMNTGDYISAYYVFQDLLESTPDDPDVKIFIAKCEQGAQETAFFLDEMDLMGDMLTRAVFSLPNASGRSALRFSSFTSSDDVAYANEFEYMEFDANSNLKASVSAEYAKLLPFKNDDKMQVLVLTHALDRYNENNRYEDEWLVGTRPPGGIILDVSYEDLLLLTDVRRGLSSLQIDELFDASKKVENLGYVSQIFQAEIINRIGSALFFLPMAFFVIILGWRYRARKKPRYFFVLLLPILPIVFHGFVFMYRSVINICGIWLVLSLGFTVALIVLIASLGLLLLTSLIILAAQHS